MGSIGDATFPSKHSRSEAESRNPIKTLASKLREKCSIARYSIGHSIWGEKYPEVERIRALGTLAQYGNARRRFIDEDPVHGPLLAAKDEAERCRIDGFVYGVFAGMFATGALNIPRIIPCIMPRFQALVGVGYGLLVLVPVGKVGEIVGSKYGRRKYQVDTLDTVTAEAKFQEYRLAAQAKFRESHTRLFGSGDASFSEVERREIERSSSCDGMGKYDYARCQFMDEDPVHGPVLRAKDGVERCRRLGYMNGAFAGLLAAPKVFHIAEKVGCFPGMQIPGLSAGQRALQILEGCSRGRLVIVSLGLGCLLFAIGPAGRVGEIVGSKYGMRKYQVDTLDTMTAEAKFQEWVLKNKTTILPDGPFIKWLDKNRLAAQAKVPRVIQEGMRELLQARDELKVKNKTSIPTGNEKFLKWLEKVRELYKA